MSWNKSRARLADEFTRLLQLDVRFYGRSFAWLSLGHLSGVVRGIATTFLMARWLDPVVLGQFRYILALFGIAGIFALSGMGSAVIRGVAQGDTIVARVALKRILLVAPIGSLALLVGAAERWWNGEPTVAIGLVIAAIAFTPYSASGLYGSILTGQEKIKELTRIAIVNNLVFAIAFVAILRMDRSLIAITLAYFGFDILFRGFLTLRELRRLPAAGNAGDHLNLGNHLSGVGVMQTIAAQLDQILVQRFGGYSSLALYSVASVIPEQLKDMMNSISGTFLQRLSKREQTEGNLRSTRRHFWIGVGAFVGVAGAYAIVAPIALPLLFPRYAEAVPLTIVYGIGLIAMPGIVGVYYMQARGMIKPLWKYYSVNALLQIGANLALIPLFGSWGAVWSRNISRLGAMPLAYPPKTETGKTEESDARR